MDLYITVIALGLLIFFSHAFNELFEKAMIPNVSLFVSKCIPKHERTIMSVMGPKGLVPAVLASLPLQRGLPNGEVILDLGYSIVLFSIVICSLLVFILTLNPHLFSRKSGRKKMDLPANEFQYEAEPPVVKEYSTP